jgi:hypothetical protein
MMHRAWLASQRVPGEARGSSGTGGLSRGAVVDRSVWVLVVAGLVGREHGAAPLTGPPARGPICDKSCAILILDLFWLVISDARHALLVIFITIRSYSCNGSLEWGKTFRQEGSAQLKRQQQRPGRLPRSCSDGLILCPGQKPAIGPRRLLSVGRGYKLPGEPDVLPEPDAIIVAPATFNTINKWEAGIADTLALGLLCEATGRGLPVVVLPYLNAAQAEHPALGEGIERLRRLGVRVLFGPDVLPLHQPRQGKRDQFPWHLTLPALKEAAAHKTPQPPDHL